MNFRLVGKRWIMNAPWQKWPANPYFQHEYAIKFFSDRFFFLITDRAFCHCIAKKIHLDFKLCTWKWFCDIKLPVTFVWREHWLFITVYIKPKIHQFRIPLNLSFQFIQNKQVATITYSTLDHVSDGFLYQLNPDGEQVHVNLEGVSLSLLKVNQSEGIPLFLQPGGANGTNNGWFNLTDASSELNATIQSHLSAAGLPPNTNIGIKVRKNISRMWSLS